MPKQDKQICSDYREIIQLAIVLILLFLIMRKLFGLIGFAGGILFGLMFANKSGKQMRKEIAASKDEEVLPKIGKEFVQAGKSFLDTVKDAADEPVKDMIKKGHKKGNALMKEAKKRCKTACKKIEHAAKDKIEEAKKTAGKASAKKKTAAKRPSSGKKTTRK
jgi:gas vesicle protein